MGMQNGTSRKYAFQSIGLFYEFNVLGEAKQALQ